MNALAQVQIGRYLNRHFVSAFQKVATFRINGVQKQGGNVAAYFCTTDGQVLHAVAGPVDAHTFLREARWANETYQLAQLEKDTPLVTFFRKAHLERLRQEHRVPLSDDRLPPADKISRALLEQLLLQNHHLALRNQGKVHLLLAVGGLPRIEQVYRVVFEQILNERISTGPVRVVGARP